MDCGHVFGNTTSLSFRCCLSTFIWWTYYWRSLCLYGETLLIPHAFEISTVVFFVAPMSLITVLYVLIGLQLHKSTVRPSRCNSLKLKRRVCKSSGVHYTKQPTTTPTQTLLVLNQEANEKLQNITKEEECRKNFAKNAQATKHVVKMLSKYQFLLACFG